MSKYKINTDKKPLSESDIANNMNFDKFYSGYSAAAKTSWLTKGMKTFLGGTITTVVIVSATFVIYKSIKHKDSDAAQAFINPPVPELNNASDNFVIDNNKDTTIVYKTGSVIYVPANSFKTKDGKDANKKVKITYREFHDQIDQIFSGIPMNYDSAGIIRPFESAGMFEVLAFENDSVPVYLKDGKNLKVNLLSHNEENRFNVYYLDTVAKKWELNGPQTKNHKEDLDKLSKEKEDFLAKHNLLDPNKLITPKKANPALNNFTIDYDKDEFPELAVYDGVKFEVSMSDPNYTNEFRNTVWEDVIISRHPDGKNYILIFKIGKQSISITANPVFDEKNFEMAMKEYEKIRMHHSKMVKAQADSLSRLEADAEAHVMRSNYKNDRFEAYVQAGAYRSILIGTMGVWNFDKPINTMAMYNNMAAEGKKRSGPNFYGEDPNEKAITAYFTDAGSNQKILIRGLFFLKRNINANFSVDPSELVDFPIGLTKTTDVLVAIGNDFKVYYLKDDDLHSVKQNGDNVTFAMKFIDISESDKENSSDTNRSSFRRNPGPNLDKIRTAVGI